MTFNSGNPAVDRILSAIDKNYPNLFTESDTGIQIIDVKGALNTLFVQTASKNPLTSDAIAAANAATNGFQRFMVKTNGLSISSVGDKSVLGSNVGNPLSTKERARVRFSNEAVSHTAHRYSFNEAGDFGSDADRFYAKSLDKALYPGTGVLASPSTKFFARLEQMLTECCQNLGSEPRVALLMNTTLLNFTTAFSAEGIWKGQIKDSTVNAAYKNFPCIPGFSRVITHLSVGVGSTGFAGLVGCTYISGPCDVDHYYVETYFNDYNGRAGLPSAANSHHFMATLVNKYGQADLYQEYKDWCLGTFNAPGFALSASQLDAACKRNVMTMRLAATSGVVLFGPPSVDISVLGNHNSQTLVVQSENQRTIDVELITFNSREFNWTVPREWYIDYMQTGYDIFTPRVSNIRENVLKQWNALEYSHLTIRGVEEPYVTNYTVSTLPEAKAYGKARAKACKTNDWLDKMAIPEKKLLWKDVDKLERAKRGRNIWMNTGDGIVFNGKSDVYSKASVVSYVKDAEGDITRTDSMSSSVINLTNEDDLARAIEDFYFNTLATFTGVTKTDLGITADEELALTDAQLNVTTNASINNTNRLIGFGSWIDSSGQADVSNLSEEQKYRLHIVNTLYYDKMLSPLKKVIESFGYETMIKFI